jgi:putative CocE/NonD family hydrolase
VNRGFKWLSLGLAALGGAYLLRRDLFARVLNLTRPKQRVIVQRDVRIAMLDGVKLAGDVYRPAAPGQYPAVLMRTPYGRSGRYSSFGHLQEFYARRFAERGYAVVVQDVRGRFDSGGEFNPFLYEKDDGIMSLKWIAAQTWCDGQIGMWGASYSGIVQWATIPATPLVKAFVPAVTTSALHEVVYPDGAFDLGLILRWLTIFKLIDRNRTQPVWANLSFFLDLERAVQPAFQHLPIAEADRVALGTEAPYYRFWLEHPDYDAIWQQVFEHLRPERVTAPAHLIGGWYDFFLRGLLEDYAKLKSAGQQPYLTIGPWHHFQALVSFADLREGLRWFDAHFKGQMSQLRKTPVRIFVMGINQWRDLPDWPPSTRTHPLYLSANRQLASGKPSEITRPSRYRYDPAHPTPIRGGAQFSAGAGARNNWFWEHRPDVLTFTSSPLDRDTEVMGAARIILYVKSSVEHTDFFGRLCDVGPAGLSTNVCDGFIRVHPGTGEAQMDGTLKIEFELWSTAYHFRKGHRVRLCIASGAHPRWSRNPGTGEPLAISKDLRIAEQQVFHDTQHPSALLLPVIGEKDVKEV